MKNILAISVLLFTLVGGAFGAQANETVQSGSVSAEKVNPFGIMYPGTHNNTFGIEYPDMP